MLPERRLYFDADNINSMATICNIPTLKRELRDTDMKLFVANIDRDVFLQTYYTDYKMALLLAIDVRRYMDAPTHTPGIITEHFDVTAIKENADIVAIAGRYTELKKTGSDFTGCCPFHSEKTGSFHVSPARQSWHCFGACNTGGDVISLVMKAEHMDFKAACFEIQRG
jgi:hypothetical protein